MALHVEQTFWWCQLVPGAAQAFGSFRKFMSPLFPLNLTAKSKSNPQVITFCQFCSAVVLPIGNQFLKPVNCVCWSFVAPAYVFHPFTFQRLLHYFDIRI